MKYDKVEFVGNFSRTKEKYQNIASFVKLFLKRIYKKLLHYVFEEMNLCIFNNVNKKIDF